jgi:RNA polymerase sigma factor (sigma-70 family)
VSIVIHVVDDDAAFRTAVGRLLQAAGYQTKLYESALQLLAVLPDDIQPGCILLDVEMPDLRGPELQKKLAEFGNILPIIFLTGHVDIPTSVAAIKAGAEDFLTKPIAMGELLAAIANALDRHQSARDLRDRLNMLQELLSQLTPRERQVFDRVVSGKQNKQIAHELGTTERTIKAHRSQVMEKLHVRSLMELVEFARELGLDAPRHPGRK